MLIALLITEERSGRIGGVCACVCGLERPLNNNNNDNNDNADSTNNVIIINKNNKNDNITNSSNNNNNIDNHNNNNNNTNANRRPLANVAPEALEAPPLGARIVMQMPTTK